MWRSGGKLLNRDRSVSVAGRRSAVIFGVLAVTTAIGRARPADAQHRTLSAWTVAACRMEVERRGWRIAASGDSYSDGWVWFRLATNPSTTSDALCGEAANGGVSLNVLSAAAGRDSANVVPTAFLGSCASELERRGWKPSGGASAARSAGTVLVQHIVADAKGTEGVGHCVFDANADTATTDGEHRLPVPIAVSAEAVRTAPTIDSSCRELFSLLGWSAALVVDPARPNSDKLAQYQVTAASGGPTRRVLCVLDEVSESVRVVFAKK